MRIWPFFLLGNWQHRKTFIYLLSSMTLSLCLLLPFAGSDPVLGVQMDSAQPRKFTAPFGYGLQVRYSLANFDPSRHVIEAYQVQVDEGDGTWRTTHENRPATYPWANIHGTRRCCPNRHNLPPGVSAQVRVRARYHQTKNDSQVGQNGTEVVQWTAWSEPLAGTVAPWSCNDTDQEPQDFRGPYIHNIYPWDYSGSATGLKLIIDVPSNEPQAVEEFVVIEGRREVAVLAANDTGELVFAEIDDYPLDYGRDYTYTVLARWTAYEDDDSCTPRIMENPVTHLNKNGDRVAETRTVQTRYADGVDAREAALRHRPLLVFDASEIYWPVSVEWMLDNADAAEFYWDDGPRLEPGLAAGSYSEEDLLVFSHREADVDFATWDDFHQDGQTDGGVLLNYREYSHPQSRHQVDSNNAAHNMGLSPAARGGLAGCEDLYTTTQEWYYDCHLARNDGRDLWDIDKELTLNYRMPNPQWKLYYSVHPYADGEYQITYQLWHAWDAVWENGDSLGVGASEFVTKHEGDQTTFRVFTSNHGRTARYVIGGMHSMPVYARGQKGSLSEPQEFKFYGSPQQGDNMFLYEASADPYRPEAYQTPAQTFSPLAYWNFFHTNSRATHPVLFVPGRSHGTAPIPGVLNETHLNIFKILGRGVHAYVRDSFSGTGMRWFPGEDQTVPIELEHPAFLHYIGWTGHWDYQDRRGPNPGWQKALTPPHSPYAIMRPWGGPGNLDTAQQTDKVIEWVGDSTRHGPGGPFAWDSVLLKNGWFEDRLGSWKTYGDGSKAAESGQIHDGNYSARIQRASATGRYFGLYQLDIKVEPNTEYRLSAWVKTEALSGSVAAALGVWSSDPRRNHHTDFGHIGGTTDWVQISGRWKSRSDETRLRVMLFGRPDFAGNAAFDGLVLQKVVP